MSLNAQMYPHLLDSILSHASYSTLVAFRTTSKRLKSVADALLCRHLTLTNIDGSFAKITVATRNGRHPGLFDWPTVGSRGVFEGCDSCIVADPNHANDDPCPDCGPEAPWRHHPMSALFRYATVTDVIGATLMEALNQLSSLFGSVNVMRFMGAWGVDPDNKNRKGMVWPKHSTRQTLQCTVKKLVWHGDLREPAALRCAALPEVPGAAYTYVWWYDPFDQAYDGELNHEAPRNVGIDSVTVVYRRANSTCTPYHGTGRSMPAITSGTLAEPIIESGLSPHATPMTIVGLFQYPWIYAQSRRRWLPIGFTVEHEQEFMGNLKRSLIGDLEEQDQLATPAAEALVQERWSRIQTITMDEYVASLSEEERELYLDS